MRRAVGALLPKLLSASAGASSSLESSLAPCAIQACKQQVALGLREEPRSASSMRSFASGPLQSSLQPVRAGQPDEVVTASEISMSPTPNITYNEFNHARFAPGTEGRPFAYLVQTGGRFLYASALRLAILKVVVSLSAAADTLALGSLEVDISGVQEGETMTVKWRGKPVFIKHRTDEEIATQAAVPMSDLKDPQRDQDRAVDPKYLIIIGICTHLGCVPIAGAGNYGGWFCPCHGSHYDGSGRIREGPAPYNLEVPEYKFMDAGKSKVMIG